MWGRQRMLSSAGGDDVSVATQAGDTTTSGSVAAQSAAKSADTAEYPPSPPAWSSLKSFC